MLEGLTSALKDIYESRFFPIAWLLGSVLAVGVTADAYWLIPGVGGFGYLVWSRWLR